LALDYGRSTVLVTGGTGSVGMVLAGALLRSKAKEVRLLSNDENGLFEAKQIFGDHPRIRYYLGDVRDSKGLTIAASNCDLVIHAAALKHLNFCEDNPYEAVSTNVAGTQNLIDTVVDADVRRFVYISTDKAVNPVSVMGATKLLGEKLTIDASAKNTGTTFACVRFGNILGSRGSVIRVFERNVMNGGPITVTDPRMTRFVMLAEEAQGLVLQAAARARSGEILVLKMNAVRIGDLAEASRDFFSRRHGLDPSRIRIKTVGARSGEKTDEELMTSYERARAVEEDRFFVIKREENPKPVLEGAIPYSSRSAHLMTKREILSMLRKLRFDPVSLTVLG
jgi:UDP-N-acetylglucosamine 4,6-dehydratase